MAVLWRMSALACVALLTIASPATAQYGKPRPTQQAPASASQIQKAGVAVNRTTLFPGVDMETLLGVVGPPDHVDAVRGKDVSNDYVRFTYTSYGFNVHIKTVNNQDNIVESIVILQSNVKLTNVPVKVGDDFHALTQAWGQPDQQEPGFMAYWKRGVYVAVGENGIITGVTIATPGKVDDQAPSSGGQGARVRATRLSRR